MVPPALTLNTGQINSIVDSFALAAFRARPYTRTYGAGQGVDRARPKACLFEDDEHQWAEALCVYPDRLVRVLVRQTPRKIC